MGKGIYGSCIIHRVMEYELFICNVTRSFRRSLFDL